MRLFGGIDAPLRERIGDRDGTNGREGAFGRLGQGVRCEVGRGARGVTV